MSRKAPEAVYTLRRLQQLLGISRGVLAGLIDAGFIEPTRGPRNAYCFSFQDAVLLRTACLLKAADVPLRRIRRSLSLLRARLPEELPLTGLRITAVGSHVAVHDGRARWEVESGQLLMDFEVAPAHGSLVFLPPRAPEHAGAAEDPDEWFRAAGELETRDVAAAEAAYRRSLALAPSKTPAYLNLGVLLCEQGRFEEAAALYEEAVLRCPDDVDLHFNRGVVMEDLGRIGDAIASYLRCVALDPSMADAHFNVARLFQHEGDERRALRHLSAYRRLER